MESNLSLMIWVLGDRGKMRANHCLCENGEGLIVYCDLSVRTS